MDNSCALRQEICCPSCNKHFYADIWMVIDGSARADLLDRMSDRTIHQLTCPYCHEDNLYVDSSILLFMPTTTPPLIFSPAEQLAEHETIDEAQYFLDLLREQLGERWQNEWLDAGLMIVPRSMLLGLLQDYTQDSGLNDIDEAQALEWIRLTLTQTSRDDNPQRWAQLQHTLGDELMRASSGDRERNIEEAIGAFESALDVLTPTLNADEWTGTMADLAYAYYKREHGNIGENIDHAIELYKQTLQVVTRPAMPERWAQTLDDLGNAYMVRRKGEPADNVEQAIAAYREALEVRTRERDPYLWAATTSNLGNAYTYRLRGDWRDNFKQAIDLLQQAQAVMREIGRPVDQLAAHINQLTFLIQESLPGPETGSDDADQHDASPAIDYAISPIILLYHEKAGQAFQAYKAGGDPALITLAASILQMILANAQLRLGPEAFVLDTLSWAGVCFLYSYNATNDVQHLDAAVTTLSEALERSSANNPKHHVYLNDLGIALRLRYLQTGNLQDLDDSIRAYREALTFVSMDSEQRAGSLNNLSVSLLNRYKAQGNLDDLEEAIHLAQEAVATTPEDSPALPMYLNNVGNALLDRYWFREIVQDLQEAVESYTKTVALTPADSLERPSHLNNLGQSLLVRSRRTHDPGDLEEGIRNCREALALADRRLVERPMYLDNIARGLILRAAESEIDSDLDEAIQFSREAVSLTPQPSPDWPLRATTLGQALIRYAERHDNKQILNEGLDLLRRAHELSPPKSALRSSVVLHLSAALALSFTRYQDAADLEEALRLNEQIQTGVSEESAAFLVHLNIISAINYEQYERTNATDTLDAVIRQRRELLVRSGVDAENRPNLLHALAIALDERFNRYGRLEDIKESLALSREALSLVPESSESRLALLYTFGATLTTVSPFIGENAMNEAMNVLRECYHRADPTSSLYRLTLNTLAMLFKQRFIREGNLDDINQAISYLRQALDLSSSDERAMYLNNLANDLTERAKHTNSLTDVGEAMLALEEALAITPSNYLYRPMYLNNLGRCLQLRHKATGNEDDLRRARDAYEEVCREGPSLLIEEAYRSAINWSEWSFARRAWGETIDAHRYALNIVEQLYRTQLLLGNQRVWLGLSKGLWSRMAYALAREGHVDEAVVTMEYGRARGVGEALERDRTQIEEVRIVDPEAYEFYLAATRRLKDIEAIERAASLAPRQNVEGNDLGAIHGEALAARAQLDEALIRIRRVPGFNRFLMQPSMAEIAHAIRADRPAVYLGTTDLGSFALIVSTTADTPTVDLLKIECVWLDNVNSTDVENFLIEDRNDSQVGGYLLGQLLSPLLLKLALRDRLAFFGEHLIRPIADYLRTLKVTSVTLIPAGKLALLPLHAAPYVYNKEQRCLLDELSIAYAPSARVISIISHQEESVSYTPILLGVGNPRPESEPLPYADLELAEVATFFDIDHRSELSGGEATKDRLLPLLMHATHIHLACHGQFDLNQPLRSHIQLARQDTLALHEILDHNQFQAARLVVLSACQTAITEFRDMPDEAISLPTGFLQAGVPGVIGTLWSVPDLSTMLLMIRFYEYHLHGYADASEGPIPPSKALRYAQQWLRDVKNEALSDLFYEYSQQVPNGSRMLSSFAHKRFQEYSLRDPEQQPFADPYFWAGFVYYGV